jgi:hypothetical protein
MMLLERFQIPLLIAGRVVLRAAVKNAEPLEGQGTNGGVMRGAGLALLLIIGSGPETDWWREASANS